MSQSEPIPTIDHNVPIPKHTWHRRTIGKYLDLANAMSRGDSVAFDKPYEANCLYQQLKRLGFSAIIRKVDNGKTRVWRKK